MTDLVLLALLASLEPVHGTPGERLAIARAASDACVDEGEWAGTDCLYVLLALAREESGLRIAPGRRWGCGLGQVAPRRTFRWRGMELTTPACSELELPEVGARWMLRILETKWNFCAGRKDRWRCAFVWYNGHPVYRQAYGVRVLRRFLRLTAPLDVPNMGP